MAVVRYFYTGPASATYFTDFDGPAPAPPAGFALVTQAAYDAAELARQAATLTAIRRGLARLQWSPSKNRVPASDLGDGYFGVTSNIAVFLSDVPGLGITSVQFKLDGVNVNLEAAAPWDYFTTDGGGFANRGTFAAGTHLVEAVVSAPSGAFTVSATIEVE